jgi:hypothetical protein
MMMMMMMIEVGMVAGERRGGRGGRGGGMMVRMATRGLCPDGRKSGQYNIRATDPIRRTYIPRSRCDARRRRMGGGGVRACGVVAVLLLPTR